LVLSDSPRWGRLRDAVAQRWLFLLLIAAIPVVEYLARTRGGPGPSLALVRNPFAAIAAASVFCRYFIYDFRGGARKWVVYLTPLTWLGALAVEGTKGPPALLWLDMLFGLGVLGTFGFVLAGYLARDPDAKAKYFAQLTDALLVPLGASMVSYGLWATSRLNPVYDTRIYAFEEILGIKMSLWSAQAYVSLGPLSAVAGACYNLVAVAVVVVAAAQKEPGREQDVLKATLVAGAFGFALYFVCPVVGPVFSFSEFYPHTLPVVPLDAALPMAITVAPRNCMPSLHTIWGLLIWFNAARVPVPLRRALRAFVILTMWAVLSPQGDHWFMDVVASVPLAVAVQSAFLSHGFESAARRRTTALACAGLTAAWLAGFKSGLPLLAMPPVLAWAAVVGTLWWPLSRYSAFSRPEFNSHTPIVDAPGGRLDLIS
jgi:PAP2 superfamily protein